MEVKIFTWSTKIQIRMDGKIMIQISHEEAKKIRIRYPKVKIVKTVNKFFVPEYNFIKRFLEESFANHSN